MTIHLKPEQEDRIVEAVRSGAYQSPDDVIERALEVLHERDEWLMANRHAVDAKIRRGDGYASCLVPSREKITDW
jgi:Arc/MetJ-type ribon-helix-helix transcriptional regulator